jgi:hypothetical protein
MVSISDLHRGDIIIVKFNGVPYHAAIYAPDSEHIGDIIHACSGFKRTGVTRGTLANLYHLHQGLNNAGNFFKSGPRNTVELQVFRSKIINGEEIANQAKSWLMQGVPYDERRLADTVQDDARNYDTSRDAQLANTFEYLKYAARRDTAPIKTPFVPYTGASISSIFGSFLIAPPLYLPRFLVNFGIGLMKSGTNQDVRVKGFTCAGFVLSCIGAVALRDEISPISRESGWVSLKYGSAPEDTSSNYASAWQRAQETRGEHARSRPGLHQLLSAEQIRNFDPERLIRKLSFLSNLHPHHPSTRAFNEGLQSDTDNWESIGQLQEIKLGSQPTTVNKPFNKANYEAEKRLDRELAHTNHQQFDRDFGQTAFRQAYSLSFFRRMIAYVTGEDLSVIPRANRGARDI